MLPAKTWFLPSCLFLLTGKHLAVEKVASAAHWDIVLTRLLFLCRDFSCTYSTWTKQAP